jgi:hypothetical protein
MKIFLLVSVFWIFNAVSCLAGGSTVDFRWGQPPDITWGTKIYIGTESGNYVNSENAGINTTEYTLENLEYSTQYHFTAVHYDSNGIESEYAPEVSFTTPDVPGVTFKPLPEILDSGVKSYTITLTIPN